MIWCRRIAYQEASQTFGVISMRSDIVETSGIVPARPSASTQALSTSLSSSMKVMAGQSVPDHMCDELDTHSLLVLDQHTFEG